jgi:hypothetical protein
VVNEQEPGWTPVLVFTVQIRVKSLCPAGKKIIIPAFQPKPKLKSL